MLRVALHAVSMMSTPHESTQAYSQGGFGPSKTGLILHISPREKAPPINKRLVEIHVGSTLQGLFHPMCDLQCCGKPSNEISPTKAGGFRWRSEGRCQKHEGTTGVPPKTRRTPQRPTMLPEHLAVCQRPVAYSCIFVGRLRPSALTQAMEDLLHSRWAPFAGNMGVQTLQTKD